MKNKLISTMVIGIFIANILNTPTLAKYIESFKPLTETIVAYEIQKTDVYIQHINKTTNEIIEQEVLNDIELDTVLVSNEYKKDISGYEYDSVESEIVQVSETNNIVKIYYNPIKIEENKFDVSINYYEKDTTNKLIESKVLSSQEEGTIINSMDYQVDIDGYIFDSVDKKELIVDKDNTSITFYYVKDNNLPDEIAYDVSLVYVDENNNEIHERKVLPSIVENTTIDSSKYVLDIEGYEYSSSNVETLGLIKDEVINLYYIEKEVPVEYSDVTIYYRDIDTNEEISEKDIIKDIEHGTYVLATDYIKDIEGYKFIKANPEVIKVDKDNNSIEIYYEKEDNQIEEIKPSPDENKNDNLENPSTSDSSITVWLGLFIISVIGLVLSKRKKV